MYFNRTFQYKFIKIYRLKLGDLEVSGNTAQLFYFCKYYALPVLCLEKVLICSVICQIYLDTRQIQGSNSRINPKYGHLRENNPQ